MTSSRMLFAAAGESTLGAGGGGREEARPSPERLDAQIRSLTYNQVLVPYVYFELVFINRKNRKKNPNKFYGE
jgi:hypothetical protein